MSYSRRYTSGFFIAGIAYLVFLIGASAYIYKKPAYNWDMLAYMALVVSIEQKDASVIHQTTYTEAKRHLPAAKFAALTDSNHHFRKTVTHNTENFNKQLAFYVVKPLYIIISWACYKVGFSLVSATVVPSILGFVAIGVLLFYWLSKYLQPFVALALGILLCISSPVLQTAKLSTPDCLSSFFLLAAFYQMIEGKRLIGTTVCLLLAIFTRIDHVIVAVFLLTYIVFGKKWPDKISLRQYLIIFSCFAGAYLLVALGATRFGWDPLFISSFYSNYSYTFFTENGLLTLKDLIMLRHSAMMIAMQFYHLFVYLAFAALLFIDVRPLKWKKLSFDQAFMLALMSVIAFRAIIYIDLSDRHFIAYFLIVPVLLARKISSYNTSLVSDR